MKKIISILAIIIGIIVGVTALFFGSAIMVGVYQGLTSSDNVDIQEDVKIEENIKIEKEEKIKLEEIELQAGFYTVGEDIEHGKYDIVHVDGQGLVEINEGYCFQIGTDRDYGDTEVVKNVELKKGDKIRVTSGLLFKFTPVKK